MEQIREEGSGIHIYQRPIAFPSSFAQAHLLVPQDDHGQLRLHLQQAVQLGSGQR